MTDTVPVSEWKICLNSCANSSFPVCHCSEHELVVIVSEETH